MLIETKNAAFSSRCLGPWRAISIIATTLLCALCTVSVANNAAKPMVVYPTGSFPSDVQNVQSAINVGGTVLLKATNRAGRPTPFNFGPPDPVNGLGVNLTTNVAIVGEHVGRFMTTIDGGLNVFFGQIPVKSHIENIDFEAPLGAAILLLASTGTEIIGNHINGVVGIPVVFGTDGDGIDLFGNDDPQTAITGHVVIANNVIENLTADFANGMQLDEVSADVSITGNTVRFAQSDGRIQTIGITAFRCHNQVSIVGNEVYMGPGNPDAVPAPMFISGDHDAHYVVALNKVVTNHPSGDGIIVTGGDFSEPTQGALLAGNLVTINSSTPFLAGIDLFGAVNDSLVVANSIRGSSDFAMDVGEGFLSSSLSDGDKLLGNDISQHSSLTTDIYFGTNTSDIIFAGRCSSDMDLGVDNKIDCAAPAARAIIHGKEIRAHMGTVSKMNIRGALFEALRGRMAR